MIERSWSRLALAVATVGYLILLFVFPPAENLSVVVLILVPIVIASGFYGLRVGSYFMLGLGAVTEIAIALSPTGLRATLQTFRGVPLLTFLAIGVVVGRLRDVRVALENELEERARVEDELRESQRRLEELLDAKDELIASVGHELRTPLTSVLGFAEMLRVGDTGGVGSADRAEMVDFIAREAFELSGIVDDLLVAARIEIGKLEVTSVPTALKAQAKQVLESWDPLEVSAVKVSGVETQASADPARVRQILRNLVSNALHYGGDEVEITVGPAASEVLVEVSDNGEGLPESEWDKIFEPYHRYHIERTQPGSIGLGLTVSRGLSELMGGSLTYRYQDGRSVLALRLPQAG